MAKLTARHSCDRCRGLIEPEAEPGMTFAQLLCDFLAETVGQDAPQRMVYHLCHPCRALLADFLTPKTFRTPKATRHFDGDQGAPLSKAVGSPDGLAVKLERRRAEQAADAAVDRRVPIPEGGTTIHRGRPHPLAGTRHG